MKKLILSFVLSAVCVVSVEAQIADVYLTGSITTPAGALSGTTNVVQITTNRAQVHSIQLVSAAAGSATFYDSDNTNAPFFGIFGTNDIYWTRASSNINYVTTNISGLTGTTNIWTNVGVFTYFVTNAANTNALNPAFGSAWAAAVPFTMNNLSLMFSRGITMRTSTNVSWIIGYTP